MWKNVPANRILRSVFELFLTGLSLVFFLAWSIPVVLAGDLTPPSCPSNCTAYADASKSMSLQNGTWSNSANPFFEWSGATDASGIYGYHYYFGTNSTPDSATFSDSPLQVAKYTASNLIDSETYHLLVKPVDASGNTKAAPCHLWTYRYDATAPISTINLAPKTGFNSLPIAVNGTVQEAHGISSVQWSIDQGQTWNNATLNTNLWVNGTSQTTKGDIDDTHEFKNKPVGSVYIKAHSDDNDSLKVQINGLSSTNGTWETLYSGTGGSGVKLDTKYLPKTFSQIRVQLDDTEDNDIIFYDYQFQLVQQTWFAGIDQLSQDGTYTLTTRALDAAGNWESPGNGTLFIYDTTPPSNPLSVQGYSDQNGTYTLQNNATYSYVQPSFQWSQPKTPGASINGYFVYFGQVPSGDPTGASGTFTSSPAYTPSPINATGTYYLNLKARDAAGNIAGNSTQVFSYTYTKDTTKPANPQNITCYADPGKTSICSNATWSNSKQPTFDWSGAVDQESLIDGYFVYFGPDKNADPVSKGTYQTTTSYTHNAGLTSGQTYYLGLQAKNKAGLVAQAAWEAFSYKYDGVFQGFDGIVASFPLNGDAVDGSGNGHNGTVFGGGDWSTGIFGQALSLDGQDDYVAVDNLVYDGSAYSELSVAAWVKTTADNQPIASWDRSEYWRLGIGTNGDAGKLTFHVQSQDMSGNSTVNDGNWHFLAATYDQGTARLYVDGQLDAEYTGMSSTFGTGVTRYGFLGAYSEASSYNGDKGSGNLFSGSIDALRIYDIALSPGEISSLQKGGMNLSIAGGTAWTNSQTVDLELTATDLQSGVAGMQLADSGNFTNATWQTYAQSVSAWPLPPGDGPKSVYARFKDGAGNLSLPISDSIVLDTEAPSVQITAQETLLCSLNATLSLNATDGNGTGLMGLRFSFDGSNWGESQNYNATTTLPLPEGDGPKSIFGQVQDKAGNWSQPAETVVTVDQTPPSKPSSVVATVNATSNSTLTSGQWTAVPTPHFVWSGVTDAGSGVKGYSVYWGTNSTAVPEQAGLFVQNASYTVTEPMQNTESYVLRLQLEDQLGNMTPPWTAYTLHADQTASFFNITQGTSQKTKGDIDDLHECSTPVNSVFIEASTSDNDSLKVTVQGYDAQNGQWETLYSGKGGSGIQLDTQYPSKLFHKIRVQLDDTENNDTIYYEYRFENTNDHPLLIDSGNHFTTNATVTLTLDAQDQESGTSMMRIANDANFTTAVWEPYAEQKDWTLVGSQPGTYTVYAQFQDQAGNLSGLASDTIELSTDFDADGLPNDQEQVQGLDPYRADSDADGYPDAVDGVDNRTAKDRTVFSTIRNRVPVVFKGQDIMTLYETSLRASDLSVTLDANSTALGIQASVSLGCLPFLDPKCEAFVSFAEYQGRTYALSQASDLSLDDARELAFAHGGQLVSISSAEENAVLRDLYLLPGDDPLLIGLNDQDQEGAWVWSSGEDSQYTNWMSGEPDGQEGANWAEIRPDGYWQDSQTPRKALVEWPATGPLVVWLAWNPESAQDFDGGQPVTLTVNGTAGNSLTQTISLPVQNPLWESTGSNVSPETADAIQAYQGVRGKIGTAEDKDYFAFQVSNASLYRFEVLPQKGSQAFTDVQVMDSSGQVFAGTSTSGDGALLMDAGLAPGTYWLKVSCPQGFVSFYEYGLKFRPVAGFKGPNSIQTVAYDTQYSGRLMNMVAEDLYSFSLDKAKRLRVDCQVEGDSASAFPYLRFTNESNGTSQVFPVATSLSQDFARAPGQYSLAAGMNGTSTVPVTYTLQFKDLGYAEVEDNGQLSLATPMPLQDPMLGALQDAADTDYFVLEIEQPQALDILLEPEAGQSFDLELLYSGQVIYDAQEHWIETALYPGSYYLKVDGAQGNYRLTATPVQGVQREFEPNNGPAYANALNQGITVQAGLYSPEDIDWFGFVQTADGPLALEVQAAPGCTVRLENVAGTPITSWSAFEGASAATIEENLTAGNYFIRVSGEQVLSYTLSLNGNVAGLSNLLQLGIKGQPLDPLAVGENVQLSLIGSYQDGTIQKHTADGQWMSLNPEVASVDSGMVTALANGTATLQAAFGGKSVVCPIQVETADVDQTYGNLILVAGGSLGEENALKQATPYLCDFMYKTFHDRGFEDEDIYYFAHSAAKDLNGDGFDDAIVDSTERTTQKVLDSIKDWATSQSTNGPLFLYLNDHGQTNAFQIAPYEILTPALLDAALHNFQEATSRTVVLMMEACHSGTFIDDLQAPNRVLITSSDLDKSYLGPDGTDSFSQFFIAELYKGASLSAAYNTACSALQELGKPQSKQQPQLDKTPFDLGPLHVVSAAVSAPAAPAISQVQIPEIYDPQADGPLIIQADVSEAQEGEAWALIKPEDYTPPLLGMAFATPVLDFQKVVLRDEAGDGSFDQHYTGQTQELVENGHYEVVVFARNKDRIVSKSGLHPLTVVNGFIGPEAAFVASPASYALPDETIVFSDSSQDADGVIVSRLWEFGDAQNSTSAQAEPEFSYPEAGTYVVSLTVTDDDGVSDTASAVIQIVEEFSLPISGLANSTEPVQSVTWTWSSNENATFRYAVNQNATWSFTDEPFNATNSTGLSGEEGTWYLHVQAKGAAGNVSPVYHASVVMSHPTKSHEYSITPHQWNLIGISVALDNATIKNHLSWDTISKIAKWTDNGFGTAEGGGFDAFTTFEPGLGYFIKGGPTAYSFDLHGSEYNQLPKLSSGWNLITLPVNLIATVSEFMNLFTDAGWEIDKLATWTGTGYGTADGGSFDAFSKFEAGEGYWVNVTATQPGMPSIP